MSERILKALMQLFAIVARPQSDANDRRQVVASFLQLQLNKELVEKYLLIYDEFYEQYQAKQGKKALAANSVKVLKICSAINEELTQKQKIIVLVRLLEFIKSEEDPTEQEFEFVSTVSDAFNVAQEEYVELKNYVLDDFTAIPYTKNLLVISSNKQVPEPSKTIYSESITGEIKVFNIASVNMQMFRSHGIPELTLNGQLLPEERVNFLTPGSSLRHTKIKPIYFSEILSAYNVDKSKARIVFETKDLVYKFAGGKFGLYPMNFLEESGNLVGIMGASGAGKSTLLNVLNGTYTPTSGVVSINGIDIHNDTEGKLKGLIGHVSQDDLLIEELTVYQNLYYNAKLCFDNYTEEQIADAVSNVLINLGL